MPDDPGLPRLRRARLIRRAAVTVLFLFVGAGVAGVFGVRSGNVTATGGGYELTVQYPKITRPGLQSPWAFTVTRDGGFGDGPVTIATTHSWLDLFDENGRNPAPTAEYVDGEMLVWEFDPPEGETLTFTFDARLSPSVQEGATATTQLREGNVTLLEVTYRTRVMP